MPDPKYNVQDRFADPRDIQMDDRMAEFIMRVTQALRDQAEIDRMNDLRGGPADYPDPGDYDASRGDMPSAPFSFLDNWSPVDNDLVKRDQAPLQSNLWDNLSDERRQEILDQNPWSTVGDKLAQARDRSRLESTPFLRSSPIRDIPSDTYEQRTRMRFNRPVDSKYGPMSPLRNYNNPPGGNAPPSGLPRYPSPRPQQSRPPAASPLVDPRRR